MNRIATLIATLSILGASAAFAQETDDDDKKKESEDTVYADDESVPSEKCLRPKMIKATHVIDDRNILFVMRDNKIYRNVLPRKCRDLARSGAFSYPTTYGRICDIDRISVGGMSGGLGSGRDCRLGPFYPVTIEEIRAIAREAQMTREVEGEAN